jgi:hypothetical protein
LSTNNLEIALSKMKIGVGFAAGRARLLGNLSVPIIAATPFAFMQTLKFTPLHLSFPCWRLQPLLS